MLGGHGPRRTPALAARFADEFNVGFAAPAITGAQIARVRAACEAIGRDPADISRDGGRHLQVPAAPDEELARRHLAAVPG